MDISLTANCLPLLRAPIVLPIHMKLTPQVVKFLWCIGFDEHVFCIILAYPFFDADLLQSGLKEDSHADKLRDLFSHRLV
mmetsp:Transcript_84184/g.132962  ORF Transcript_84184/g.132962 Transcript_84184/m.132962 type:complete len:80 (-) Transcript_84184:158-397(-)